MEETNSFFFRMGDVGNIQKERETHRDHRLDW